MYTSVLMSYLVSLSLSHCVRKSVLYVCLSIHALQVGSSVCFSRFHTCVLIYGIIALYCTMLSCIRLFCDPMDCCPPGSSLHGIFRNTGVGCRFLPKGSSPPRDHDPHSCTSCIDRWILYHCTTWEALNNSVIIVV